MTQLVSGPETSPRFSIISAVYNVSTYLPDFIASVDAQAFPAERLEVIAVDDGSTDESLALLRDWERRRPGVVRVLTKQNGGQSTARNLGLEVARGEWVTFTDPDDVIEPDYLSEVDAFLRANPETLLVGTNRVMLNDATGELTDNHPLRMHFREGNRLRNLDELPKYFHGSAPAAFFRLSLIAAARPAVRPLACGPTSRTGTSAAATCSPAESPEVGFVATARYHYRKRQNASSTLQTSLVDPDRYTKVLRNGYLSLLRDTAAERGEAPEWLQNYVLYELSWYFSSQDAGSGVLTAATGEVADEFHDLMRQITELLSDDVIASFDIRPLKRIWKEILLHSYRPEPWHTPFAVHGGAGQRPGAGQGQLPLHRRAARARRSWAVAGRSAPRHAKVRDMSYHGRTLLHERVVWLPLKLLRRQARRPLRRPALLGPGLPRERRPGHRHAPRVQGGARAPPLCDARRGWSHADRRRSTGQAVPRGPARAPAVPDLAGTARLRRRLGAHGPDPRRGRQRRAAVPLPATQPPRHQRVVRHRGRHAGLEEAARPRATPGSCRTGRCAGSC